MTSGLKSLYNNFITTNKVFFVPVRYRYHSEKIAKGHIVKDYGYKDRIFQQGVLPRLKDAPKLNVPVYRPANNWNPKRTTFGQNDYIDILGGGKLRPTDVCYDIPKYLRGRKGNEYQLLLAKQKYLWTTTFPVDWPTKWYNMARRVKYLYKYLNRKTKNHLTRR